MGHLPDRQELPQQRRNDREFLRRAYQDDARCGRHQRPQGRHRKGAENPRIAGRIAECIFWLARTHQHVYKTLCAGIAELVDAPYAKCGAQKAWGFASLYPHHFQAHDMRFTKAEVIGYASPH